MTKAVVQMSGIDGWCFGVEFFIQAALFARTGYADWEIEFNDKTLEVRRALIHSFNGGIELNTTYRGFKPIKFALGDNMYSWQTTWKEVQRIVSELKEVPPYKG